MVNDGAGEGYHTFGEATLLVRLCLKNYLLKAIDGVGGSLLNPDEKSGHQLC
jgi:hypothetical protein